MAERSSASRLGVAEDLIQGHAADLRGACDVGLSSPGGVCSPCKALNGSHGIGCLAFGVSTALPFDDELGEDGIGLHTPNVQYLTIESKVRTVLYMRMSTGYRAADPTTCQREHRHAWRVEMRCFGFPAFQGHVCRETKDSGIICDPQHGGCGRRWRTTAAYVATLPDYEPPAIPEMVCQDCGRGDLPDNPLVIYEPHLDMYDHRWRGVYHERGCR